MSYLTIGRRICHLKMSYLTIGHPQAQHLPNILRLPRPRVRLRWTSTRATMNMLSANASAMRCVVNGVKMTMMRDVARRLTRGKRQRDEMENGEDDDRAVEPDREASSTFADQAAA